MYKPTATAVLFTQSKQHHRRTAKRVVCRLFACLAVVLPWQASAMPVAFYDFDDALGGLEISVESSGPHLAASSWSDLDATLTGYAGNPGKAIAAKSWDDGNAFRFDIEVEPGFSLDLDGFSFDEKASASGAQKWKFSIDGTEIANGATATSFVNHNSAFSLTGLTGTFAVLLAGMDATGTTGTWRIDNFELRGGSSALAAPVPLPAPFALLAISSGFLLLMRRRNSLH